MMFLQYLAARASEQAKEYNKSLPMSSLISKTISAYSCHKPISPKEQNKRTVLRNPRQDSFKNKIIEQQEMMKEMKEDARREKKCITLKYKRKIEEIQNEIIQKEQVTQGKYKETQLLSQKIIKKTNIIKEVENKIRLQQTEIEQYKNLVTQEKHQIESLKNQLIEQQDTISKIQLKMFLQDVYIEIKKTQIELKDKEIEKYEKLNNMRSFIDQAKCNIAKYIKDNLGYNLCDIEDKDTNLRFKNVFYKYATMKTMIKTKVQKTLQENDCMQYKKTNIENLLHKYFVTKILGEIVTILNQYLEEKEKEKQYNKTSLDITFGAEHHDKIPNIEKFLKDLQQDAKIQKKKIIKEFCLLQPEKDREYNKKQFLIWFNNLQFCANKRETLNPSAN